jgi:hypothetical protein
MGPGDSRAPGVLGRIWRGATGGTPVAVASFHQWHRLRPEAVPSRPRDQQPFRRCRSRLKSQVRTGARVSIYVTPRTPDPRRALRRWPPRRRRPRSFPCRSGGWHRCRRAAARSDRRLAHRGGLQPHPRAPGACHAPPKQVAHCRADGRATADPARRTGPEAERRHVALDVDFAEVSEYHRRSVPCFPQKGLAGVGEISLGDCGCPGTRVFRVLALPGRHVCSASALHTG